MAEGIMPNFFIIGSAKSGTTSLHQYLNAHPEIYMSPVKEPAFFSHDGSCIWKGPMDYEAFKNYSKTLDEYLQQFKGVGNEKAIGDASPQYLDNPDSAGRIKQYVADAKIIAVLRNPVDRAYSDYLMKVRENREPCASFALALDDMARRISEGWAGAAYTRHGFYYRNLLPYINTFGKERLKVFLYEDFCDDSAGVYREILQFLEVDPMFQPNLKTRLNTHYEQDKSWLNSVVATLAPLGAVISPELSRQIYRRLPYSIKRAVDSARASLSPQLRAQLIAIYRKDILQLGQLIERDLQHWISN